MTAPQQRVLAAIADGRLEWRCDLREYIVGPRGRDAQIAHRATLKSLRRKQWIDALYDITPDGIAALAAQAVTK